MTVPPEIEARILDKAEYVEEALTLPLAPSAPGTPPYR